MALKTAIWHCHKTENTPEDLATERLVTVVESAIDTIQECLANLAAYSQEAKWSVSDLVRLLAPRNQLQAERLLTIFACWVEKRTTPRTRKYRPRGGRQLRNGRQSHGNPPAS